MQSRELSQNNTATTPLIRLRRTEPITLPTLTVALLLKRLARRIFESQPRTWLSLCSRLLAHSKSYANPA